MDFKTFKNSRSTFMEDLNKKIESLNTSFEQDTRYWQVTKDKAGTGSALVRFLPGRDTPWVRYWSHSFKSVGGWYIENSRTSIKEDDPVSEYNGLLWNTGNKEYQDFVSKDPQTKRKLYYVSNILVIDDPANPGNNGKVFLFQYGAKIYEKIKSIMQPTIKTIAPVNPFDPFNGANFQLIIKKVAGYPNYDDSKFIQEGSKIDGNDDVIEKIYNDQYDLETILSQDNFKPYQKLKERMVKVLGMNAPLMEEYLNGEVIQQPKQEPQKQETQKKDSKTKKKDEIDIPFDLNDGGDIDEAYIKALANS